MKKIKWSWLIPSGFGIFILIGTLTRPGFKEISPALQAIVVTFLSALIALGIVMAILRK